MKIPIEQELVDIGEKLVDVPLFSWQDLLHPIKFVRRLQAIYTGLAWLHASTRYLLAERKQYYGTRAIYASNTNKLMRAVRYYGNAHQGILPDGVPIEHDGGNKARECLVALDELSEG